jgi:hypothetical protein
MVSCSNRQKSKVLNLIYKALNSKFGDKINIKRDAMHRRYDVNKFCLELMSKNQSYKEMIDFLKDLAFNKLNMEEKDDCVSKYYVSNKHGYQISFATYVDLEQKSSVHLFLG